MAGISEIRKGIMRASFAKRAAKAKSFNVREVCAMGLRGGNDFPRAGITAEWAAGSVVSNDKDGGLPLTGGGAVHSSSHNTLGSIGNARNSQPQVKTSGHQVCS